MLELIAGVFLALGLLVFVIHPLWSTARQPPAGVDEPDASDPEESESPKVQALLALKEIDFDRATGKLSEADYADLKARYTAKALRAMQEEDAGDAAAGDVSTDSAERMIARAGAARDGAACPSCGPRPEVRAVFCSTCGRSLLAQAASPRCWICGATLLVDAAFCADCGADVTAALRGG